MIQRLCVDSLQKYVCEHKWGMGAWGVVCLVCAKVFVVHPVWIHTKVCDLALVFVQQRAGYVWRVARYPVRLLYPLGGGAEVKPPNASVPSWAVNALGYREGNSDPSENKRSRRATFSTETLIGILYRGTYRLLRFFVCIKRMLF